MNNHRIILRNRRGTRAIVRKITARNLNRLSSWSRCPITNMRYRYYNGKLR